MPSIHSEQFIKLIENQADLERSYADIQAAIADPHGGKQLEPIISGARLLAEQDLQLLLTAVGGRIEINLNNGRREIGTHITNLISDDSENIVEEK